MNAKQQKMFLITGTRKGIGKCVAEHYLSLGHVVAGCSRGEGSIEHENYRHSQLDISDENKVIQMVRSVKREFGTIGVLINNAGIASMNHFLLTSYESAKKIFDTNWEAPFTVQLANSMRMVPKLWPD